MVLVVRGAVKDYDWGIVDGLAAWSDEATGGPQAELWFGVHPGGPSPLIDPVGDDTGEHLGHHFDVEEIPLLVKLLAAARPLSVQVHPDAETAAAGWKRQQQPGEPRVLSDPFEKTEMMIALEPFEAFAGWRSPEQAAAILENVQGTSAAVAAIRAHDIPAAIRELLSISAPERIGQLAAAAQAAGLPLEQIEAYRTVQEQYPNDSGALLTAMLDYLTLDIGEAVYVPAGVPHSYIRGTGVEVMTSSDNVIRLGLTGKPVFVDRAIEALRLDLEPQIVRAEFGDTLWPTASPFVVRLLRDGREKLPKGAYRIVVNVEGKAIIDSDIGEISLRQGTAAVIGAGDPDAWVETAGLVAVVQSTQR